MNVSICLAIAGIVVVLFGLDFLLLPELSVKQYGVPADPHGSWAVDEDACVSGCLATANPGH